MHGFWSYVHKDDQADNGVISQLIRDVDEQYEALTGERLSTFFDRKSLSWGDDWRQVIEQNLDSVAFFIPVLTPRYFQSEACRYELDTFIRAAKTKGVADLVLPLLYIDFDALNGLSNEPGDELVELVRGRQWEDWTSLRFADTKSPEYRLGVWKLVQRIKEVNANLTPEVPSPNEEYVDDVGDQAGLIDRLAQFEEATPAIGLALQEIRKQMEAVGSVTQAHGSLIKPSTTFAERRNIIRRFAQALEGPVEEIYSYASTYVTRLRDVDDGLQAIVEELPGQLESNPALLSSVCEVKASVQEVAISAETAIDQFEGLREVLNRSEGLSREIRPVIRRLKAGITKIIDGRSVYREWLGMFDRLGIDCGNNLDDSV